MSEIKQQYEVWQIDLIDVTTGNLIHRQVVMLKGYSEVEAVIKEIRQQLENVGVDPITVKINIQFKKYARKTY